MEETRVQIVASGLVQGVGFRWFVARHASDLNIRGYVRNLYDGNVEIQAEGSRAAVEELLRQIRIGPRASRVTRVNVEWLPGDDQKERFKGFEIR
jgi:acylphosphatase